MYTSRYNKARAAEHGFSCTKTDNQKANQQPVSLRDSHAMAIATMATCPSTREGAPYHALEGRSMTKAAKSR